MLTLKQILSQIFHRELFFYRWIWQMHTFISRYPLIADRFCYLRLNWWLASILIQFQVHTPLRSRCGPLPPDTEGSVPASHAEIPGPVPHLGCLKNPQLCQGPGPLESPSSVPDRNGFEAGLQEEGSHDRHFKHRLWSSVHGQTSVRLLVNPGAALAYQLPRNHGSSSSTQSLPARPEGVPCLGLFGHDSGSLRKPPLYRLVRQPVHNTTFVHWRKCMCRADWTKEWRKILMKCIQCQLLIGSWLHWFWRAEMPFVHAAAQTWFNQASVLQRNGVFPKCQLNWHSARSCYLRELRSC